LKKNIADDEFLRKRSERQKKLKKRRLKAFFAIFIILLLLTGATLSLTVFFPIKSLSFTGSAIYTAEEIEKASNIKKGDNLFTVSRSKAEDKIRAKLPYVEKIEFKRKLPDKLMVKVYDAEEFISYMVDDTYYIVSQSGWVLKKTRQKPENICTLIGAKVECKVGKEIKFDDENAKLIADRLSTSLHDTELTVNTIDVSDIVSLKLEVEGRFKVKIGTSNFIEEKVKHLASMIKELGSEEKGNIDLSMWTKEKSRGTFTKEK